MKKRFYACIAGAAALIVFWIVLLILMMRQDGGFDAREPLNIRAIENALCRLMGVTPQPIARSHWLAAAEYHTTSADQRMFDNRYLRLGVPAQMLEQRPDIRMANAAMEEAFYNTQAARAAFFPSITLTAQGGWTNSASGMPMDPAKLFLNFVGSLTQPIFDCKSI